MNTDKFLLGKEEAVLVMVDIQERLANVMSERKKVVDNCLHLIEAARLHSLPVIINEQYPKGLGPTVSEITGALDGIRPFEKMAFSCWREKAFQDALASSGRRKIILSGMETHVCVLQTCIDLLRGGYVVHVVGDAVCSRNRENFDRGLEFMRDAGAVITCTETVLFQLLEKAGTEEFRIISRRIK